MYIAIKDSKVYDMVDGKNWFKARRFNGEIPENEYFKTEIQDIYIGDTWDFDNNTSLKDSPQRSEEPPKTELELKVEELEQKNQDLENRIIELESKITATKK